MFDFVRAILINIFQLRWRFWWDNKAVWSVDTNKRAPAHHILGPQKSKRKAKQSKAKPIQANTIAMQTGMQVMSASVHPKTTQIYKLDKKLF